MILTYIILGILVTILTFIFTDEKISIENTIIGVLFWPFGVIYFLFWLSKRIFYEMGI